MPPDTLSVRVPDARNYSNIAREWLEAQGFPATIPSIRSRDEHDVAHDPFLYYLKRRLGLVPILYTPSPALSRGSWVHKWLEGAALEPKVRDEFYSRAVEDHLEEVRARCQAIGWEGEKLLDRIAQAQKDADCVRGWMTALCDYRGPACPDGFLAYLNHPNKTVLATELTVTYNDPRYPKTKLAATFDRLTFYPLSKTLWVDDYKSSEESPLTRAETVRHSFQTLLYRYLLRALLDCGFFHRLFPNLPPDTKVGGMTHILIQKPKIKFCAKDRPYLYTCVGKRPVGEGRLFGSARATPTPQGWSVQFFSRIDKEGYPYSTNDLQRTSLLTEEAAVAEMQTWCGKEPSKEYSGEPSPLLYAKRCLAWYNGERERGDDEDNTFDPPINFSTVEGDLDETELMWFKQRLDRIYEFATCTPDPIRFPPTGRGMTLQGGKLSVYAPFFTNPVTLWPQIIQEKHFTQYHLDTEEAE